MAIRGGNMMSCGGAGWRVVGSAIAFAALAAGCSTGNKVGANTSSTGRPTSSGASRAVAGSGARTDAPSSATTTATSKASTRATLRKGACVDRTFDPGPIPPKRRETTSSVNGPTYRSDGRASIESGGKTTSQTLPRYFSSYRMNDYYSEDFMYFFTGEPSGYSFELQTTHDGSAITSISDTHPVGSDGGVSYNFPLLHPAPWMGPRSVSDETIDHRMKLLLTHSSPGHWDFRFTYEGCHPPTDGNAKDMRIDISTNRDSLPDAWRAWTLDVDLITGVDHFRKHISFTAQ